MGLALIVLLLTVPVIEIAVFIEVGGWIGLWPTIALIVLTAFLGSWQLRLQGLATLERARRQLDRGEVPAKELFDGLCLMVGGVLLLTPGFVTDLSGALLFVPAVRTWLRGRLGRYVEKRARAAGGPRGGDVRTRVFINGEEVHPAGAADPHSRWGRPASGAPGTIEGDWSEVRQEPPGRIGRSGRDAGEDAGDGDHEGRDRP